MIKFSHQKDWIPRFFYRAAFEYVTDEKWGLEQNCLNLFFMSCNNNETYLRLLYVINKNRRAATKLSSKPFPQRSSHVFEKRYRFVSRNFHSRDEMKSSSSFPLNALWTFNLCLHGISLFDLQKNQSGMEERVKSVFHCLILLLTVGGNAKGSEVSVHQSFILQRFTLVPNPIPIEIP